MQKGLEDVVSLKSGILVMLRILCTGYLLTFRAEVTSYVYLRYHRGTYDIILVYFPEICWEMASNCRKSYKNLTPPSITIVHEQKFEDLLSSTFQISSESGVFDLESEVQGFNTNCG